MVVYTWCSGEDLTCTMLFPLAFYDNNGNQQYISYVWYGYNVVTIAI
jgi:hypothetical protein